MQDHDDAHAVESAVEDVARREVAEEAPKRLFGKGQELHDLADGHHREPADEQGLEDEAQDVVGVVVELRVDDLDAPLEIHAALRLQARDDRRDGQQLRGRLAVLRHHVDAHLLREFVKVAAVHRQARHVARARVVEVDVPVHGEVAALAPRRSVEAKGNGPLHLRLVVRVEEVLCVLGPKLGKVIRGQRRVHAEGCLGRLLGLALDAGVDEIVEVTVEGPPRLAPGALDAQLRHDRPVDDDVWLGHVAQPWLVRVLRADVLRPRQRGVAPGHAGPADGALLPRQRVVVAGNAARHF
mmetsp:Transcript_23905/g.80625  ORF Transcript_23905/g.80625 Transcript_23905/m.80625 type:complete len:297 (-) Transcript_23905:1422-2312(-)